MKLVSANKTQIPERITPGTTDWVKYEYEHRQRYAHFAHRCQDLVVLDAACGIGYGSSMLVDAGAAKVVGIDLSREAINYANQYFANPSSHFLACDVLKNPLADRSFDAVVSFETIEHVSNPSSFVAEVARVLKIGGIFICSTPNKHYRYRGSVQNPYHQHEMSYDEFTDAFTSIFDIEEIFHQSPSEHYRRHLQLIEDIQILSKPMSWSMLLRIENALRVCLKRHPWPKHTISPLTTRVIPGDYMIEQITNPCNNHLTFILVGRLR
ncbi:MAG: class I SAM-dependent methyltransferase [Oscillochloridaceae bacterium umkhey_bin13]